MRKCDFCIKYDPLRNKCLAITPDRKIFFGSKDKYYLNYANGDYVVFYNGRYVPSKSDYHAITTSQADGYDAQKHKYYIIVERGSNKKDYYCEKALESLSKQRQNEVNMIRARNTTTRNVNNTNRSNKNININKKKTR